MRDRLSALKLGVPDVPAARALADAWVASGIDLDARRDPLPLEVAEAELRAGRLDLAFIPSLSVLRDPEAFSVVPGVALVGKVWPSASLHLPSGLAALAPRKQVRIGLDPRFIQEALLAQVIVKEAYGASPMFVPLAEDQPLPMLDAHLIAPGINLAGDGVTLDLGREWFEMTTRPMVWGLLASVSGGIEMEEARQLRDATLEHDGIPAEPGVDEPSAVTLAAYAYDGLEAWMNHLFYHKAIDDLPEIPFLQIIEEGESEDDEEE